MIDWHTKRFASAEKLRQLADREETLANAAELDGDEHYAVIHRRQASHYREEARKKEIPE